MRLPSLPNSPLAFPCSAAQLHERPLSVVRGVIASIAMFVAVFAATTAWAQANKPVTQDITLTTKDGVDIKITYFKSASGQEAPVVVMLHGKGGNRLVWKSFAELLQKAEFAVITVDMRGHGESTPASGATSGKKTDSTIKARDYAGMIAGDMEAVKRFIYDENQNKQLNMNKLAIVAADVTTPVAIAFTEIDWEKTPYDDAPTPAQQTPRGQDVRALALLSPESTAPGVLINKSLGFFRTLKLPVLISVSKNGSDAAAARKVHELLAPNKEEHEQIEFHQYDAKLRGTDMLGKNLKTEEHLFNFLVKYVKESKSMWRDRKSKLLD